MQIENDLSRLLQIRFPMIMAPMFLVSNEGMMKAAMDKGIAGCFPSLNYRKEGELDKLLDSLNIHLSTKPGGTYGVNLIVQKTNPLYSKHLAVCVEKRVPFYITSLGSPREVIEKAKSYGAKVFCDVTNLAHAQKCRELGADGFIAVGQGAGGHAGPYSLQILVPALRKEFPDKVVIAAGSMATGEGILSVLALGASGVSVGTRFIASAEAGVSPEYKQAIVDAGMEDIVMSDRISGTPSTVINTPYARKLGTHQNWLERMLSNNARTKKYFKMLVQIRGMKKLEASIHPGNYKTLWIAGQSSELIHDILPCADLIDRLITETAEAKQKLDKLVKA
ncbi:MAG: NAD(P)H-dependent flavin oxidoreductase [Bacteroidia bacterium]